MKIIDTNVLIRLGVDEKYSAKLENELSNDSYGYVDRTIVMEAIYVLQKVYGIEKAKICNFLEAVLLNPQINHDEIVLGALRIFAIENIGFADCIIIVLAISDDSVPLSRDKKLMKVFEKYKRFSTGND